jgi:hypothetical protein
MEINKYSLAVANIALCCASSTVLEVIKEDLNTIQELIDMHEKPINNWAEFKAFEWYYDKKHDEYVQFVYDKFYGIFYFLAPCYHVYEKDFEKDRICRYEPVNQKQNEVTSGEGLSKSFG